MGFSKAEGNGEESSLAWSNGVDIGWSGAVKEWNLGISGQRGEDICVEVLVLVLLGVILSHIRFKITV